MKLDMTPQPVLTPESTSDIIRKNARRALMLVGGAVLTSAVAASAIEAQRPEVPIEKVCTGKEEVVAESGDTFTGLLDEHTEGLDGDVNKISRTIALEGGHDGYTEIPAGVIQPIEIAITAGDTYIIPTVCKPVN